MSSPNDGSIAPTQPIDKHLIADIALRAVTAVVFAEFAISAISHWLASPTRVTLVLLVVANCFTTALVLFARTPTRRDWRPLTLLMSLGGSYAFLFYNLNGGIKIVPEAVGALLQMGGIAWQLFAKISLKRSFGILPANRGVVSRGAYRFVRHPMYLGYLLTDVGFLLTNFSLINLSVHVTQVAFQIGRIVREEKMLETDVAYRCYRNTVRYRLIPLVF
jgi:protein-S-isoprenylcysteine O-methyltransferase Ste14